MVRKKIGEVYETGNSWQIVFSKSFSDRLVNDCEEVNGDDNNART